MSLTVSEYNKIDMNILYHHRTQGTGAEGVHIAYVIKGLRQLEHQVDVVSPNDLDPTQTAGNNPFAKKEGLKRKVFSFLSRSLPQCLFELLEIMYNFSASKKLTNIFKKNKIDFIYERNAFFLYAGAKLAQKHNIPLIIEVNEVAGEKRIRKQFFVRLAKKIETFVFNQADAIIVVSNFLKQKIVALGIAENKIHVIPNAADEKLFTPEIDITHLQKKYHLSSTTQVIGFIGWFVGWHNLNLLIQSFADAAHDHDVRLMLVGDGTLKDDLIKKAQKYGVADKLIFSGAVKYQNIPQYVKLMDICVIPGSNEYRSPIKLFEYMLMGKTVVAPKWEPIEMIVKDKEDALLFTADHREEMTKCFKFLLKNKEISQRMGQKAREKVLQSHLWIHNAQRVIKIFKEFH